MFILHTVVQQNHIVSILQSGLKDFKEKNNEFSVKIINLQQASNAFE